MPNAHKCCCSSRSIPDCWKTMPQDGVLKLSIKYCVSIPPWDHKGIHTKVFTQTYRECLPLQVQFTSTHDRTLVYSQQLTHPCFEQECMNTANLPQYEPSSGRPTSPSINDECNQHSAAQHSAAQRSTAQHSTAQHSTAQHSTAQHSTAQHSSSGLQNDLPAQPSEVRWTHRCQAPSTCTPASHKACAVQLSLCTDAAALYQQAIVRTPWLRKNSHRCRTAVHNPYNP